LIEYQIGVDGGSSATRVRLARADGTELAHAQGGPSALAHANDDDGARAILLDAGRELAAIARALDPTGALPLALCGGLGASLRPFLPAELLARTVAAEGDAASGALGMIAKHVY
jgi:glucosamine kinase